MRLLLVLVFSLLACVPGDAFKRGVLINASFVASVSSCTAPCSIFVDATATTAPGITQYPFHELHYTINYGDPLSGSYGASNGVGNFSRNVTYGPLGAHVFETPGVYTITLTVRAPTAPQGTWSSKHVATQVTITDPAVTFPTTATKCFSTSGNFTGCPAGASQVTTSSYSSIITTYMQTPNTGIRALLRCGETFTYTGTAPAITAAGPGILATYGGCGKAVIRANSATQSTYMLVVGVLSNWSIADLKLDPDGTTNEFLSGVFSYPGSVGTLFLRLETMGTNRLLIYSAIDTGSIANPLVDQLTFAENNIIAGDVGEAGGTVYFDGMTRLALIGNTFDNDGKGQHVIRTQKVNKAVYFNNNFSKPGITGKTVLTIHGWSREPHLPAGQFVFGDNWIVSGDQSGGGLVSLAPQYNGAIEPIENVLFERNMLLGPPTNGAGINIPYDVTARYVTFRNNIYNARARNQGQNTFSAGNRPIIPTTAYLWSYNNSTLFPGTTSETTRCYRFDDITIESAMKNDLCYAPNASNVVMLVEVNSVIDDSNNSTDSQVRLTAPNWLGGAGADMITPQAFALQAGSYGIGTGTFVPVYDDIFLTPRGAQFDKGAVKFQ